MGKYPRLFGTNGIRGVVNVELTPQFVTRIGMAIGTYFSGKEILIGWDSRTSSEYVANIIKGCLVACGCDVYEVGLAPTPATQYLVKRHGFDGAVIVTASHNPPQYNGIKVVGPRGIEIPRSEEEKIEELYWEEKFTLKPYNELGNIHDARYLLNTYIDDILSRVDLDKIRKADMKIVIDCANGAASLLVPELLKRAGVRYLALNSYPDGRFPDRPPEPRPDTVVDLIKTVRDLGCIGIAYDGDADRSIFIDETGEFLWGDRSGTIIASHIVDREVKDGYSRIVVTPVSSSKLVEEVLTRLDIKIEWTPVGAINVSYKILETNAFCGFEENGGFLYTRHNPVRDGPMTTMLMLNLLAETGKRLHELYETLPKYYAVKLRVEVTPEQKEKFSKVVEVLKEEYSQYRQIYIDGIRVDMEDGWFLVRPSGTEPIIRIFVEHKDPAKAQELATKLKNIVEKILKG
ncbi:MAG: phosphoglucosamine mutase [Crenarchaeota archaeon]|nr:phosphoglucosamine mutase [Thermoproteota archaeon]